MDRQKATDLIGKHEGRRSKAYTDSEGILTVGIGANLEDKTSRSRIAALGVNYDDVCTGDCELTDEHIDTLFSADLDVAIGDAENSLDDFGGLPEPAQLAVVDMVFQLGGPGFRKFKATIAALNARDFLRAADEMADSLWARQTPNRAAEDMALVRGCAA
jgi:lysozyme